MAASNGLIKLKDVVNEALWAAKLDDSNYKRFFQFGVNGYRELKQYYIDAVKKVKLSVNTNLNTVDFPTDYLDFIACGLAVNGKLYTFTKEDRLITTTSLVGGNETYSTDYGEGVDVQDPPNNEFTATGGINQYYFTLDEANSRLIINGVNIPSYVHFWYNSSGLDNDSYVKLKYKDTLIAWILWKDVLYDRNIPMNTKQLYEQQYYIETEKIKALERPSIDEWYDLIYSTFTQGVRR